LSLYEVVFDTEKLNKTIKNCQKKQEEPDFFLDKKTVKKIGAELRNAEDKLLVIKNTQNLIDDSQTILEMLENSDDNSLFDELNKNLSFLETKLQVLKIETLLNGRYDKTMQF